MLRFMGCEIPRCGLLYISVITGDVEHFMYLLAIYMSSWENVCSVPHSFLMRFFVCLFVSELYEFNSPNKILPKT